MEVKSWRNMWSLEAQIARERHDLFVEGLLGGSSQSVSGL